MLLGTYSSQVALPSVGFTIQQLYFVEGVFTESRKFATLGCLLQYLVGIFVEIAIVIARSVSSVMTQVERLLTRWGRSVLAVGHRIQHTLTSCECRISLDVFQCLLCQKVETYSTE